MKTLFLTFHPNLKTSKVNAAWTQAAKEAGFKVRDMYSEYPNFKIDVAREQADLLAHDRIIFQFPFYWYSTPSLMKQWIDDVFTYGFAYGPPETLKLKGKDFGLSLSTGGPKEAYVPGGYNNYTVPELLRPLQQTAQLCDMNYLTPFWMNGAIAATEDQIKAAGRQMVEHWKTFKTEV
jgi:putative NADPH-quinone reductase